MPIGLKDSIVGENLQVPVQMTKQLSALARKGYGKCLHGWFLFVEQDYYKNLAAYKE